MSSEHWAKFNQTKKFTFQYVALGIPNNGSFILTNSALTVEAVKLFVGTKEIIRLAVNVPNPFDWLKKLLSHIVEKVSLF